MQKSESLFIYSYILLGYFQLIYKIIDGVNQSRNDIYDKL